MCPFAAHRLRPCVRGPVACALLQLTLIYGALLPLEAAGQQVLVDDPMSVETGAAQLEAWHSQRDSHIIPAVRVLSDLEIAAGTAFAQTGSANRRRVEYTVEGKLLLRPGSIHRFGAAFVAGAGARQLAIPNGRPNALFGYGILSQDIVSGRLTAYQNVGWVQEENGPHQLTWGARLDWAVFESVTLIGEIYGEGATDPFVQVGLRTVLLPDRVESDVSITRAGPYGARSTWLTVGFTFMSRRLY